MISRTVLIALEPFGEGLSAQRAGAAVGRGLRAGNPLLGVDLCPIDLAARRAGRPAREDTRGLLEALDFDARMQAARAVVVGAERLDEHTLAEVETRAEGERHPASVGSAVFEIATRARQAGVPAYAVAAQNALSPFDARILDLQIILQARNPRALRRAGETLAGVV